MGKSIKYAFLGWILTCIVVNVHAQTLPVDTINGWQLSWNDEFNYPDSELENNWISDNQSYEGFVLCSRWRENAEVHDGILELKARKEKRGDNNWTCGNVCKAKVSSDVDLSSTENSTNSWFPFDLGKSLVV